MSKHSRAGNSQHPSGQTGKPTSISTNNRIGAPSYWSHLNGDPIARSVQDSVRLCHADRSCQAQRQSLVSGIGQHSGNRSLLTILDNSRTVGRQHAESQQPSQVVSVVQRQSDRVQKLRGAVSFTFSGQLDQYSPTSFDPSPYWTLEEWVAHRLTVFSNQTRPSPIAHTLVSRIRRIHDEVPLVPLRKYVYQISVSASVHHYDVSVTLLNHEEHLVAGVEAKRKAAEDAKRTADAKAAQEAEEKAKRDADFAAMRLIDLPDGTIQFVPPIIWKAEQERLRKVAIALATDIPVWRQELQKAYDDVGFIGRMGSAYSGKGVLGWRKPQHIFYWFKLAEQNRLEALIHLAFEQIHEAYASISTALWCVEQAQKEWNNWYQASAQGAGTAVKFLTGAKYAGFAAGMVISGGTIAEAGLVAGSLQAGGFAMAYDYAEQRGNIIAGTQQEFDAWRNAKIGAATFFLNFVGGGAGSKIANSAWGKALASRLSARSPTLAAKLPEIYGDIIALIPNDVIQELGTTILGKVDPQTFKRPEDLIDIVANDPSWLNTMMLWGERAMRRK